MSKLVKKLLGKLQKKRQ